MRPTDDQGGDCAGNNGVEAALKELLDRFERARQLTLEVADSATGDTEQQFLKYMCFRLSQQGWVNELHLRLCAPTEYELGNTGELERMWSIFCQSEVRKKIDFHRMVVPDSWLVDISVRVLGCKLNKVTDDYRIETIAKLVAAASEHSVFAYDGPRNTKFRSLIEGP